MPTTTTTSSSSSMTIRVHARPARWKNSIGPAAVIAAALIIAILRSFFTARICACAAFHHHYFCLILDASSSSSSSSSRSALWLLRPLGGVDAFAIIRTRRIIPSSTCVGLVCSTKKTDDDDDDDGETTTTTTTLLLFNSTTRSSSTLPPPIAKRDEDCVVLFGGEKSALSPLALNKDDNSNNDPALFSETGEPRINISWLDPPIKVPDPYGWMRVREEDDDDDDDEKQKRVMDHIEKENRYTEQFFSSQREGDDGGHRRQRLHQDLVREYLNLHGESSSSSSSSQKDDDDHNAEISQLYLHGDDGSYYYTKRLSNQPYPLHCRVKAQYNSTPFEMFQNEQVILDENEIAKQLLSQECDDSSRQDSYFAIHSVIPIFVSSSEGEKDTDNCSSLSGVAFSVDLVGDESYTIFVRDSQTSHLRKVAEHTSGTIECVNGDQNYRYSLHYVQLDPVLHRPFQWVQWQQQQQQQQGQQSPPSSFQDVSESEYYTVLHTEPNERYWCDLSQTSDGKYLLWKCETSSAIGGAILALDLCSTKKNFLVNDRRPSLIKVSSFNTTNNFVLDHRHGQWWLLDRNCGEAWSSAHHHQLFTSSCADASIWTPVTWRFPRTMTLDDEGSTSTRMLSFDHMMTFADHVVVQGRQQDGLQRIWVLTPAVDVEENQEWNARPLIWDEDDDSSKNRNEPVLPNYVAMARKQAFHSDLCILTYESMVTPRQILQVNLTTTTDQYQTSSSSSLSSITTLYEQTIPGYCKTDFVCKRLEVPSRDGITRIPVSLVYHKKKNKKKKSVSSFPCPLHLLGYGAYGHSLEPSFSTLRIPLLKRGVICAVAHVRGGGELGTQWHESGKGVFKENSIHDFCDVAKWLVEHNWTKPECMAAEGRSAGGLLVASAMNQNPDLFRCVVLGVPFVDILCTMADSTLPLTALEWDEWGNPHTQEGFHSIGGYAPMHNIAANKVYPSCLLIGGWKDPRVPYWEPLKFAAALRHSTLAEEGRPILVKIDTRAGHSFGSNRSKYFEELAWIYTFVLDQIAQ